MGNETTSLSDLFAQFGISEGSGAGRKSNPIVRETYDALNNGASVVYVFGKGADDAMLGLFASAPEVIEGNALVLHDAEVKAQSLKRSIEYRNADAKNHAEVTFGKVHTVSVSDADGTAVGVKVW